MREVNYYEPLSWEQAIALASDRRKNGPAFGGASESLDRDASGWRLCTTFEECLALARSGWTEGAEALQAAECPRADGDPDTDWHLSVAGFFPEVGAYVAGNPDCMFRLDVNPDARKRVRVFVKASYAARIPASFMVGYAQALAAYVRSLEAAGYSVSLVSVDMGYRDSLCRAVPHVRGYEIKRYDEPMMLSRIAFAEHPDFFRRVVFAIREQTPKAAQEVGSGCYGYSHRTTPATRAAMYAHVDQQLEGSDFRACLIPPANAYDELGDTSAAGLLNHFITSGFTPATPEE